MRKFLLILLSGCGFLLNGQQTILFHENFDLPSGADSVNVSSSSGTNPILWNDTNLVSTSGTQSFHLKGSTNAVVSFETRSFSTVGANKVFLNFKHIAKVYGFYHCKIYVSVDNGLTYNQLGGLTYEGNNVIPKFLRSFVGAFNHYSYLIYDYPNPWYPVNGDSAIPDNSWWVTEYFNLTSHTVSANGGLGFPQVKLKFEGDFVFPSPNPVFNRGWFIDDIEVVSSGCEIVPPITRLFRGSFGNPSCQDSLLSGDYSNGASFSQTRNFLIHDNQLLDSVNILEIVNGTARPLVKLNLTSTNQYSHTFTNYSNTDSVKWRVDAYDLCGNVKHYPDTGYFEFQFVQTAQKCANGDCGLGHSFIDDFPFKQDFNSQKWGVASGSGPNRRGSYPIKEGYDITPPMNQQGKGWSINKGPQLPHIGGPYSDNSPSSDGKFMVAVFHTSPYPESSEFILPCIDLQDSVSASISFYHFMTGSGSYKLAVEIDTTKSASPNWEPYFEISGQQQTTRYDSWRKSVVSLLPFKNKILKVRFLASCASASNYNNSIAIDDIEISRISAKDASVITIKSPNTRGCQPTSAAPVEIEIYNNGADTLHNIPLAYQLNNSSIIRDTLTAIAGAFSDTLLFTFSQALAYNSAIPNLLSVWTELQGDADLNNDTLHLSIPILQGAVISSFPYYENFENATAVPNSEGLLNTNQWILNATKRGTNLGFVVTEGLLNNYYLGPSGGFGPASKFLLYVTEPSALSPKITLESRCVDLSGLLNPELHFMTFENTYFNVLIREPGMPWTSYPVSSGGTELHGVSLSLQTYAGKEVQIAFEIDETNFVQAQHFVGIDDILIREKPLLDLAPRYINLTRLESGISNIPSLNIDFTSWGQGGPSGGFYTKARMAFINRCDTSAPVIYGASDSLQLFASTLPQNIYQQAFTNIALNSQLPGGEYLVKVWLQTQGDSFSANDTAYTRVTVRNVVQLPYFEDFENCSTGTYLNGASNQWEVGIPQKVSISSAYSGNQCLITNADSAAWVNKGKSSEIARLPDFYGLDTLYETELRLWQNFDFGSHLSSVGVVEIYDGSSWVNMHNTAYPGVNWNQLMKNTSNSSYPLGFSGSSNGWVYSRVPLKPYSNPGKRSIRFILPSISGLSPGWAVDDVEIYVPPQNSASPKELLFINALPVAGSNTVNITLQNTGAAPLKEVNVVIEENSTILLQEKITLTSPLAKGNSSTISLSQPLVLNRGMSHIIVRTTLPNSRLDGITADDTLLIPIYLLTEVDSVPQCFDFEANSAFVPYSGSLSTYDSTWTVGTPNKTFINSAHSGSKAWYIGGDSAYSSGLNVHLYTPYFPIGRDTCYRFSFWHNFDTEKNFDGGNVQYTLDSGITWHILGQYFLFDSLWYNTPYVQSLNFDKPGFTGKSIGWQLSKQDFNVFASGRIQFRFWFASDADIQGEGWAIDDVCFEAISGKCGTIGVDDETKTTGDIQLYPVPSSDFVMLESPLSGPHDFTIFDQRGARVKKWTEELSAVSATIISIEGLPAGIYWLQITDEFTSQYLKFIKQ